jgi:hypothetical protein
MKKLPKHFAIVIYGTSNSYAVLYATPYIQQHADAVGGWEYVLPSDHERAPHDVSTFEFGCGEDGPWWDSTTAHDADSADASDAVAWAWDFSMAPKAK